MSTQAQGATGFWSNSDVGPDTRHIRNRKQREEEVLGILDDIGFNWRVFIAVSAGFLASSYTIFSSNIVTPLLEYVYGGDPSLDIDLVTISTTTVGMLLFGHLADRFGRKRLYGLELFIIILGTIGIVQSSNGYMDVDDDSKKLLHRSLNVYAAIKAWRGIQGLGIGAEYPLSAVIAAEFSSTKTRGVLMAAFFGMQSVGRVLAYLVALGAVGTLKDNHDHQEVKVDWIWRLVIGISAIPALLAIGLRLTIPESPRYFFDIAKDLKKASQAVQQVGGRAEDLESVTSEQRPTVLSRRGKESAPWLGSAWDYLFRTRGAWKELLGISLLWFLLDVAFYGLGLDSPSTLHRLWLHDKVTNVTVIEPPEGAVPLNEAPAWNEIYDEPYANIREALKTTAIRTLLLSSIASIMGSIAAVMIINRFSRRSLMASTSGILCILFIITGVTVLKTTEKPPNEVAMVFFALTQFMFNLGPNTLTFIVAAESFPTVFRGTFHGVAAAFGKLGALLVRGIMSKVEKSKDPLANVLFIYAAVMFLMVVVSLVPGAMLDVQEPRSKTSAGEKGSLKRIELGWRAWIPRELKNKTLEEIAPNPENLLEKLEREGGNWPPIRVEHPTPEPEYHRSTNLEPTVYPPSVRSAGYQG